MSGAIARWLLYVGLAAITGGVMTAVLLSGDANRSDVGSDLARRQMQRDARRLWLRGLALVALVTLVRAWVQVDAFRDAGDPFWPMAQSVLWSTSWGRGLHLQVLGMAISLLAARLTGDVWRPSVVAGLGALLLVAAPAWQGHAAGVDQYVVSSIIADVLHAAAFATWIGTLLSIWSTLLQTPGNERGAEHRAAITQRLIQRFSPVALLCSAILVLTGTFAAWLHLTDLNDLWRTTWGRLLLAKLVAVGVVMAAGAYNWRVVTPRLGSEQGGRMLRAGVRNELLVATIVLVITAVLTGTGTPGSD